MSWLHSPRTAWFVGIAVMVALGGGAAAVWQAKNEPAAEKNEQKAEKPLSVRAFEVRGNRGTRPRQLTGSVRPRYQTDMAFRVSGKILRRHVEVGQSVKAGQLLFELDPVDFELQWKSAEANLESAKAAVLQATAEEIRLRELRRTSAVSASEYDRGLSDRDIAIGKQTSAAKQLELAQNQLSYCKLVADSDGTVTSVSSEAGQVVTLGSTVCSIAQLQELEAVIDVPENQRLDANPATTQATFWSLPGVSCHARLREISPTADPLSRTFRARFTLLDPSPEIKLGMTVTIALDSARVDRGFDIPASCIVQVNNQPAVWRIAPDGSLTAVPVHVVQYSSDFVRVEGELHTGDRIVSAGAHRLDAGVRVRTWETQQ